MSVQNGQLAENLAATFLEQNSYNIRERNWHFGHKEIDIIADDGKTLVIVEVKGRQSKNLAVELPQNAVNKTKQKFLIQAANVYIERNNIDLETRFDIIAVVFNDRKYRIYHIKDAFYPLV